MFSIARKSCVLFRDHLNQPRVPHCYRNLLFRVFLNLFFSIDQTVVSIKSQLMTLVSTVVRLKAHYGCVATAKYVYMLVSITLCILTILLAILVPYLIKNLSFAQHMSAVSKSCFRNIRDPKTYS